MTETLKDKKVWELLNVIPIIELENATPEERAEIEKRSIEELNTELKFQRKINKPVSEFLDEFSTKDSSG